MYIVATSKAEIKRKRVTFQGIAKKKEEKKKTREWVEKAENYEECYLEISSAAKQEE